MVKETGGIVRLVAVCKLAQKCGIQPAMTLSDALALAPTLKVANYHSAKIKLALAKLANWATCFTPWVAINGVDGLWLDITGCSDIFGSEKALLDRLYQKLTQFKITSRIAAADTPGAAWAISHFTKTTQIPPKDNKTWLNPLPISALRLDPQIVKDLELVGIRYIKDLLKIPRVSLSDAVDQTVLVRLDQALGIIPEPISPRQPAAIFVVRHTYAEPIITVDAVVHTLNQLLPELCAALKKKEQGIREVVLNLFQIDGKTKQITVGTNQKLQEPKLLSILFIERLKLSNFCLTQGTGIEAVTLTATITERLRSVQIVLDNIKPQINNSYGKNHGHSLADLIDRITNRFADCAVVRFTPRQSHIPERSVKISKPILSHSMKHWSMISPRPIHLFTPSILVEAVAMLPESPPILFRWENRTHHVARANGPERIAGEWWYNENWTRDYYQVEDSNGARFWIYREGLYRESVNPTWWLHGLFA